MLKKIWYAVLYRITRLRYLLSRGNYEILNQYYRKCGVKIGKNCLVCTPFSLNADNVLLEIGDDSAVSVDVTFVLHDFSISRLDRNTSNLYGKIVIGKNCFIGTRSVLMYGVELADNVIVAAGSVVTKSVRESNVIVGGNPARVIGTWEQFGKKIEKHGTRHMTVRDVVEKHPELLVQR